MRTNYEWSYEGKKFVKTLVTRLAVTTLVTTEIRQIPKFGVRNFADRAGFQARGFHAGFHGKQQIPNALPNFRSSECCGPHWLPINGWFEFVATLQLRTPLRVLRWHGKMHTDRDNPPPQVVEAEWEGVRVLKPRTWKELGGVTIPEFEPQSASDIGPVEASKYFPYLLGIHEISEGDQMRHVKEES